MDDEDAGESFTLHIPYGMKGIFLIEHFSKYCTQSRRDNTLLTVGFSLRKGSPTIKSRRDDT
jgi:hypothetical protein